VYFSRSPPKSSSLTSVSRSFRGPLLLGVAPSLITSPQRVNNGHPTTPGTPAGAAENFVASVSARSEYLVQLSAGLAESARGLPPKAERWPQCFRSPP
jgi:hypothetical protein